MKKVSEYSAKRLHDLLPFPQHDAHKYSRGKVIAVVGSARYPGAACLAACASERMGAGYTEVFTDSSVVALVQAASYSLVVRPRSALESTSFPCFSKSKPCAYVLGSGFDSESAESALCVRNVLTHAFAPVVVDGGALASLASAEGAQLLQERFLAGQSTVLTPHEGEASVLARQYNLPTGNPKALARLLSLAYGVTVVLKGPQTYISDGEAVVVMNEGTSVLAKAGTGDILAGMLGSLLAQGLEVFDACVLATTLHARAGCEAGRLYTPICATAQEVIAAIPLAILSLKS